MAILLHEPKDLDTNLISLVEAGDSRVHVLDYKRWERLPNRLKSKYYPLTRHQTGGYRLYPKYMAAREDLDPTRKIVSKTQMIKKSVVLPPQSTKDKVQSLPYKPVVSTDPATKGTDIEKKSFAQMKREARSLTKNRATVTTQYSKY